MPTKLNWATWWGGGEVSKVGSFDSEKGLLEMCYMGSRVLRGTEVANQNISLSFDPSIMTCITCPKEHSVFRGGKSVCVCVSDQNFVSKISQNKLYNFVLKNTSKQAFLYLKQLNNLNHVQKVK